MVQLLRPGPHGMSLPSREELEVRVKELLRTLQTTSNWFESKMAINNLLGSSSFTLGAVAGMTRSLVVSAHDLACLANTLALAEYYDLSHSPSLWRRIQSRMMFTSSAGAAFLVGNLAAAGWSMQQMTAMASNAHKERQALFDLLADVFGNPSPFFDQLKSDMSETYQAFMGHLGSHSLSGNFKAGELFGELLLNVLLIADGITAAAKLISAAPRLLQNLARLKRLVQRMPGSGAKAAEEVAAGVVEAKTPSQMVNKPPAEVGAKSPGDGVVVKPKKLVPGSAEHKADRWKRYQERGGEKSYNQWSKQYDTNMRNYQYGGARETEYRAAMDASEGTLKTPYTNRQIDILKADERYAGQLKTGPVSLTKENVLAIQKDGELVEEGWTVEHILEKGASKPYLDALDKAGIQYKIGPQIP